MINLGDRLHAATEEGIVAGADEIDAGGGQTQAQFNASVGSSIGETADSSVSSTIFGWLKSIRDFLVGIVTTNPYAKESTLGSSSDSSSSNTIFGKLAAILAAFNNINIDTTSLAQRSDVKDGNDTAIGMLKDATNGLAAIKSEAAAAKTAAQAITIPTDYAKQGDDPTATLTDAQAYAQAAAEAAQSLTSLDSDINAGKQAIAAAITSKGVPGITPQDTLVEMANGVMQIAQQPIEIDGGDMYAAQLTGDGTLWDLYKVLADMKNRFINASYEHGGQTYNFEALIVCEYYKGCDSLQLQGADCYFTCDGDFYDYAQPLHTWHDGGNGKMNRWVAFLYQSDGSRLDITNTEISPRSMYIGGHIGTIEYFVNGRLTDFVCGVEDTDVVDNLLFKGYLQNWSTHVNIKAKNIPKDQLIIGDTVFNNIEVDNAYTLSGSSYAIKSSAQYVHVKLNSSATISGTAFFDCNVSNTQGGSAKLTGIVIDGNIELLYGGKIVQSHRYENGGTTYAPNLAFIHAQGLTKMGNAAEVFRSSSSPNLNDVIVGTMTTNLRIKYWNPTTVLADATKKAKLIENIKNNILDNISDATGGTQLVFTVSTNMYNAVASETITWQDQTMSLADAFLTKNWLLAGA